MLLNKAYKLLNFLVFFYDQFDPDRTYNDINILKISKISGHLLFKNIKGKKNGTL